jgi:peptide chain release factor 1
MIERLNKLLEEYDSISKQMSKPEIIANIKTYSNLAKEHRRIDNIIPKAKEYVKKFNHLQEDKEILSGDDKELKELVKDEILQIQTELNLLEQELKIFLLPEDPNDDKNIILEIRSGTGGTEAAMFAENLFRMYVRFCEHKKWKHEILSISNNEGGGVKEVIFSIMGAAVYAELKYE